MFSWPDAEVFQELWQQVDKPGMSAGEFESVCIVEGKQDGNKHIDVTQVIWQSTALTCTPILHLPERQCWDTLNVWPSERIIR